MQDFRPYLSFAKTSSNVSGITSLEHAPEEEYVNAESEDNSADPTSIAEPSEINNQFDESQPPTSSPVAGPSRERSKKRKEETPSSVEQVISYLQNKNNNKFDATECLFLAYAKNLKTFSGRRQVLAKLRIAQVMMEEELLNLQETSGTYTTQQNDDQPHENTEPLETIVSQSESPIANVQNASNFFSSYNPYVE